MQLTLTPTVRALLKPCFAALVGLGVLAATAAPNPPGLHHAQGPRTRITMNAGTVFNLSPVFDGQGQPVFPWQHEVRGIVRVSNLGNCKVFFAVNINAGTAGHSFDLAGQMTITTAAGDKLESRVTGWATADPDAPGMYNLYYAVEIKDGTGQLKGAWGWGDVEGAFMFSGTPGGDDDPTDDLFCDG
ncbi:MAG TPA: hypothetical protein P5534_09765 [Candidatus Paceibacterota bacterium]|nr:hypothetical protein [Candidatus Paceibacterota bacterium]HRZ58516.1 hypothetical protein [Candidatus Paceibacterota bacterium]